MTNSRESKKVKCFDFKRSVLYPIKEPVVSISLSANKCWQKFSRMKIVQKLNFTVELATILI